MLHYLLFLAYLGRSPEYYKIYLVVECMIKLNINNKNYDVDVPDDMPLLWVLRDILDLKGSKYGCGIGQCGACTVHIDGVATRSCLLQVGSVGSSSVLTIEGLAQDEYHPVQKAWKKLNVAQCGYCQSGQIMSAVALIETNKAPNDKEIDNAMSGNICRCGTYTRIRKAIKLAAQEYNHEQ